MWQKIFSSIFFGCCVKKYQTSAESFPAGLTKLFSLWPWGQLEGLWFLKNRFLPVFKKWAKFFAFPFRSFRRGCQIRLHYRCPEEKFEEKMFFFLKKFKNSLSLFDIEQKIFRCLLNFVSMSIDSAFYVSIETLTCEETFFEKKSFFRSFPNNEQTVLILSKNLL